MHLNDVNKAKVPIYMVAGKHDILLYPEFSKDTALSINKRLVKYKEVNGGHNTFMVSADVTEWTEPLLEQLAKFNK